MTNRLTALALACLFLSAFSMAQGTNANLTGTILDPTGAVVPNVTVSLENVRTGIILTNVSNEAGVYVFPAFQPGLYRLTAAASGFRKQVVSDFTVEVGARMNRNVSLEVASSTESVEVTASADSPLFINSASVGGVINARKILELPLPDRDALGLVLTQPGLVGDNFSGARIGALNVTRDGINIMDQRINSGVNSVIFSNVDVIDEVRVITSPVDAEFGRGSGQVQISTRSGTNEFHGSVYEFHRNSVLNANNWFNNLQGVSRDPLILNQFWGKARRSAPPEPHVLSRHIRGPAVQKCRYRFFDGLYTSRQEWHLPVLSRISKRKCRRAHSNSGPRRQSRRAGINGTTPIDQRFPPGSRQIWTRPERYGP